MKKGTPSQCENQVPCDHSATTVVHWPGRAVRLCAMCAMRAQNIAAHMGFELESYPVTHKRVQDLTEGDMVIDATGNKQTIARLRPGFQADHTTIITTSGPTIQAPRKSLVVMTDDGAWEFVINQNPNQKDH